MSGMVMTLRVDPRRDGGADLTSGAPLTTRTLSLAARETEDEQREERAPADGAGKIAHRT